MWATLTDEELVSSSALIVIGEWREISAGASGSIIVTEVLKGKAPPSLVLTQASGTGLKSSTDLVFRTGDRGLWLLRQAPGNTDLYFVDHPQRFMPLPLNEERLRAIKRLIAR